MRKVITFNNVTLDGYFTDKNGDMSFAHQAANDGEWKAFAEENAKGGGMLLFGRVTYEMMASYWSSPIAAQQTPGLAARMNSLSKVVFSRTLDKTSWNNTQLVKGDLVDEVRRMKKQPGVDMVIL